MDDVQGPVQRPQPAGPRRRHPLDQPLHRDHAQHRAATRPRSATSARSCSTSTCTADGEIDHAKLRETIRIAVRALDNVIDVNFYPTEPAQTANQRHRPVGLGRDGPAVRALPRAARRSPPRRRRVLRRGDGGDRLLRLRGVERPGGRARRATRPTRARSGTAACCRRTRSTCSRHERGEAIDVPRGGAAGLGAAAGEDRRAGHAQLERARDRADGHDREHHGHLALHRADLQEPVRQVEPVRRLHRAQPVPGARPEGRRPVGRADGRAAQGRRGRRQRRSPRSRRSCASATGRRSRSSPSG